MRKSAPALVAALATVACSMETNRPTPRPQASVAPAEAPPPVAAETDPAAGAAYQPEAAPVAPPSDAAAAGAAASPAAVASAPPSPSPSPSEKTDAEIREETGKNLQSQVDFYAKHIAAQKAAIEKAQLELNDLTNYTFGGRRKQLADEIEEAQKQVREAEAKIGELEEQARRAGIRISRP
jgi:hypothetical protein